MKTETEYLQALCSELKNEISYKESYKGLITISWLKDFQRRMQDYLDVIERIEETGGL